jgi:hypothetical protein
MHRGDGDAPRGPRAFSDLRLEARPRIELAKHAASDREASDNEPILGDEGGHCRAVSGGAEQPGGNVLGRAIFGQCAPHLL